MPLLREEMERAMVARPCWISKTLRVVQTKKVFLRIANCCWLGMAMFVACSAALTIPGCGGGKGPIVNVAGTVTFNGAPVPSGYVTFVPVDSNNYVRDRVTSKIRDGHFEVPVGEGLRGGREYRVEVDGYQQPSGSNSDEQEVARLFPLWTTNVTVPGDGGDLEFNVTP